MEVRLGVRKEGRKRDIDTYEFELAYELLGRASISSMLPHGHVPLTLEGSVSVSYSVGEE